MIFVDVFENLLLAEITDVDEGGLRSPVKITQQGTTVTIESTAIPAKIAGAINADATELIGTFTQGPTTLPVTLRRAPAGRDE